MSADFVAVRGVAVAVAGDSKDFVPLRGVPYWWVEYLQFADVRG